MTDPRQLSASFPTARREDAVEGLDIFYREAGSRHAPGVLLLHGFPSSSFMFRHLLPALADRYRVVAPDYPGFGYSAFPDPDQFDYSFENYARVLDVFTQAVGLDGYVLLSPRLRLPDRLAPCAASS